MHRKLLRRKTLGLLEALQVGELYRFWNTGSILGNELSLSPSEVHGAIGRLRASRLLHAPQWRDRPNISALEEFLIHGLKYAFPAKRSEVTRGVPTSYAAEPLNE